MTTTQAAKALGISSRRVLALIDAGRLKAVKFGAKMWAIDSKDLKRVAVRKPGRPPRKKK